MLDMIKRRALMGGARLPAAYQEVEYLENTSKQSGIDTGVPGNTPGLVLQSSYYIVGFSSAYCSIFSNYKDESVSNCIRIIFTASDNNTMYANCNSVASSGTVSYSNTKQVWHNFILSTDNHTLVFDGVSYAKQSSGAENDRTIRLFNSPTYTAGTYIRLKEFEMSDTNGLIRQLVPCYRKADSKPGMYDLCGSICSMTNTPFYVNAGTGVDFSVGADVY